MDDDASDLAGPAPAAFEAGTDGPDPPGPERLETLALPGRLAKATIVLEVFGAARSLAIPLLLLLIASGGARGWLVAGAVGAVLSVLAAVARTLSLSYGVVRDQLVIRSGILQRRVRRIPIGKIQNIDLRSGLVQRALGVVEIKVETAGSAGSEAHLRFVSRADGRLFRRELLARRARLHETRAPAAPAALADEAEEADDAPVLWHSRLRELVVAGATENRVGALVAGIWAVTQTFEDFDPLADWIEAAVEASPLGEDTAMQITALVVVLAVFALLGWALSILITSVTFWDFTLRRREDGLQRRHGLFTEVEALVPLARIQVVRVEDTVLRRLLGVASMRVATAGSATGREHAGDAMMCPLLRRGEAPALVREVFDDLALDESQLHPVHPYAFRRGLVRAAVPLTLLVGAGALAWTPRVWLALLAVLPLAWAYASARYASLGWATPGRYLLARGGVFTRRLWIVPKRKVQSVELVRGPIQRLYGLATVRVHTAGAETWAATRVVDMALDDALALLQELGVEAAPRPGRAAPAPARA